MPLLDILGHDGPARRTQEPVDPQGRAAVALAPLGPIGSRTLPPVHDAPVQDHSDGLVPCKRSLEMLVELLAMAGDDDEMPDSLRLVVVLGRRRHAPVRAPQGMHRRAEPLSSFTRRSPRALKSKGKPGADEHQRNHDEERPGQQIMLKTDLKPDRLG